MSQFKKKLTAFTAMLAFLSVSGTAAFAYNVGDVMGQTGNMTIKDTGNVTQINNYGKTGAVGQVDWGKFNVAKDYEARFGFSAHSQTIINRVLGGELSQIYGKLTSQCLGTNCSDPYDKTGKVILINPAGVMFGNGSQVDLNSFTVSTFDIKNARNLDSLTTKAQKDAYQLDFLNKMSPVASVAGELPEGTELGDINFDSHHMDAFAAKNITYDPNAKIVLDRTAFARFNADGTINDNSKGKAVALVGNHIDYKDSLVRAGSNLNYSWTPEEGQKAYKSYGSVKLITADGVTFKYTNIGNISKKTIAADKRTDQARTIKMDNANIAKTVSDYGYGAKAGSEAIKSGDIDIYNVSNKGTGDASKPEIHIKDSFIKATKLVSGETGDIYISGSQNVKVENSRLETKNTYTTLAGTSYNTDSKDGGQLTIVADKDVTLKDSVLWTASSKSANADKAATNGRIKVYSNNGNINSNGSEIISGGNADVVALKDLTLNNTLIESSNDFIPEQKTNLTVKGKNSITATNSKLVASSGDLIISSDYNRDTNTNKIIIQGDLKDGQNQSFLYAKNKLSIQGKDTTVDDTTLAYETLKFYNDGSDIVNNVTIANNTNFASRTGLADLKDVNLETNGHLTLDNATAKVATFNLDFNRTGNGQIVENSGAQTNIGYTFTNTSKNADNITLTSVGTGKNVSVINNSNVNVNNDAIIDAKGGNVNVNDSTIIAANKLTSTSNVDTNISNSTLTATADNVDITATTGNIEITNGSAITAGKDATIKAAAKKAAVRNSSVNAVNSKVDAKTDVVLQKATINSDLTNGTSTILANDGGMYIKGGTVIRGNDILAQSGQGIDFGKVGSGASVEKDSDILATNNITFKSTTGDITAEKADTAPLTYKTLDFNAAGSNNFTSRTANGSDGSFQSVNVTYTAGTSNNFTTDGDIRFVNSALVAGTNNITTVGENADVILNELTIGTPEGMASKDVHTTILANGDVTTLDAVGDFAGISAGTQFVFPQDVNVNANPPADLLTADGPKLNVNGTKLTVKTNTTKNAADPTNGSITLNVAGTSAEAGLELTAQNKTYDGAISALEGPEVRVKSADGKAVAISKIITDKLWLDRSDEFVASTIEDTSDLKLAGFADQGANTSKGYIEVRDYGGLNLDTLVDGVDPEGIVYDSSFETGSHGEGDDKVDTYEKHTIHFTNNDEDFMLVYTKPNKGCGPNPPAPPVDEDDDNDPPIIIDDAQMESYIAMMKLPKEIVEASKVSRINDVTASQTGNVMAAAAKIGIGQGANGEYEDEDLMEPISGEESNSSQDQG